MDLNIEAGLPILKPDALDTALRRYAQSKAASPPHREACG
jgi:hypothetical protein